ncbi:transposase [Candidatus Bipolaricaulota bacterium]|nr:transposase [Candidatus Bipolaricaulota bacterium]
MCGYPASGRGISGRRSSPSGEGLPWSSPRDLPLYAAGASTRAISRFLEVIYGALYSSQSISHLTQVVEEEVKAWRERPLNPEYYAIFLDGTFLHIRRGQTAKEPVYLALGILPDGRREILGFWLLGAEGESTENWEEVLKELRRRGVERVRTFISDDLPRFEEAIKKIFPKSQWQLCVLHAVRDSLNEVRKGIGKGWPSASRRCTSRRA